MVANCKDLRDAVALCLQRSECVLIERHTPKECFTDPELSKHLPQPCYVHILRYMDCRRGMADRTKRLRGNGPLSSGKYEADLQMMKRGDFDPETELEKLSAEHVTQRDEAVAIRHRDEARKTDTKNGWFSWWRS